eukprot:Rmarinus@m.14660
MSVSAEPSTTLVGGSGSLDYGYGEVDPSGSGLRQLILEKEKELHDINDYRIRSLEALMKDKDSKIEEWQKRFHQLKEDFQYNLKLIEERDAELDKFDVSFAQVKTLLNDRDREVSEVKTQLADVQGQVRAEKDRNSELEIYYQDKIAEIKSKCDTMVAQKDEDLRHTHSSQDAMRREYDRKVRDAYDEMEMQKRELSSAFDKLLRERTSEWSVCESEFREQIAEMDSAIHRLSHDLKTKVSECDDLTQQVHSLQQTLEETKKQVSTLTWELGDVKSEKDDAIGRLKDAAARAQDDYKSKVADAERRADEIMERLHTTERTLLQDKKSFQAEVKRLEDELQTAKQTAIDRNWEYERALKAKDNEREDLLRAATHEKEDIQKDLNYLKLEYESKVQELKSLSETVEQAKKHLDERNADVARYKDELSAAQARETELRRKLKEAEAKFKQEIEMKTKSAQESHEDAVRTLASRREELAHQLEDKENQLASTQAQLRRTKEEFRVLQESHQSLEDELQRHATHRLVSHVQKPLPSSTRANQGSTPRGDGSKYPPPLLDLGSTHAGVTMDDLCLTSPRLSPYAPAPPSPVGYRPSLLQSPSLRGSRERGDDSEHPTPHQAHPPQGNHGHYVSELEAENRRLVASLAHLRSEMESFRQGSRDPANVSFNDDDAAELRRLREENAILRSSAAEEQHVTQREIVVEMQSTIDTLQQELDERTQQLATARNLTREKEKQLQSTKNNLAYKLEEAESEVERLRQERDKLMDISNAMKAELSREVDDAMNDPLYSTLVKQAERDVVNRYERRIAEIESAMQDLVRENRQLRSALHTATTLHASYGGDSTAGPSNYQVPVGGAGFGTNLAEETSEPFAAAPTLRPQETTHQPTSSSPDFATRAAIATNGVPSHPTTSTTAATTTAASAVGQSGVSQPARVLAPRPVSASARASTPPPPAAQPQSVYPSTARAHADPLPNGTASGRSVSASRERLAQASSPNRLREVQQLRSQRTRSKLDEVRRSIELSGQAASMLEHPPVISQSRRGTASQQSVRRNANAAAPRKRTDLALRRQGIRNYNIRDVAPDNQ